MITLPEYLAQTLSKSTVQNYLYTINRYLKNNKNTSRYTYQKVMQYIEILRPTLTPQSLNREIAALKKYYDYLIEIGKRKDNPTRAIKVKDAKENPIQLQDLLTQKELETLLIPRKERYPFLAKRNQIVMSLLINQALRIGEIENIKINDIDLENATLQVKETGLSKTAHIIE